MVRLQIQRSWCLATVALLALTAHTQETDRNGDVTEVVVEKTITITSTRRASELNRGIIAEGLGPDRQLETIYASVTGRPVSQGRAERVSITDDSNDGENSLAQEAGIITDGRGRMRLGEGQGEGIVAEGSEPTQTSGDETVTVSVIAASVTPDAVNSGELSSGGGIVAEGDPPPQRSGGQTLTLSVGGSGNGSEGNTGNSVDGAGLGPTRGGGILAPGEAPTQTSAGATITMSVQGEGTNGEPIAAAEGGDSCPCVCQCPQDSFPLFGAMSGGPSRSLVNAPNPTTLITSSISRGQQQGQPGQGQGLGQGQGAPSPVFGSSELSALRAAGSISGASSLSRTFSALLASAAAAGPAPTTTAGIVSAAALTLSTAAKAPVGGATADAVSADKVSADAVSTGKVSADAVKADAVSLNFNTDALKATAVVALGGKV